MSTGVGESVLVFSVCSGCDPSPLCFLIVDICGSFLAFEAAPIIKTNFASKSLAIVCSACSLAYASTFWGDVVFC
jgi:hypothetical protein